MSENDSEIAPNRNFSCFQGLPNRITALNIYVRQPVAPICQAGDGMMKRCSKFIGIENRGSVDFDRTVLCG